MSSAGGRGKALELALAREAAVCLKTGRAALVRQYPRTAVGEGGSTIYAGESPIDFLGVRAGGRALALEAKETDRAEGLKLDEDHLSAAQIKAARALARLGAEVQLVIDYKRAAEVYAVAWPQVEEFLAAPWRASLSLEWARAYGLLLPELERNDAAARRVLFLDGSPHPDQAAVRDFVKLEQVCRPVLTLDELLARDDERDRKWGERRARKGGEGETLAQLMARRPAPDDHAAYIKWLDEYTARELEANAKRARKAQRGKPGAWKGGGG